MILRTDIDKLLVIVVRDGQNFLNLDCNWIISLFREVLIFFKFKLISIDVLAILFGFVFGDGYRFQLWFELELFLSIMTIGKVVIVIERTLSAYVITAISWRNCINRSKHLMILLNPELVDLEIVMRTVILILRSVLLSTQLIVILTCCSKHFVIYAWFFVDIAFGLYWSTNKSCTFQRAAIQLRRVNLSCALWVLIMNLIGGFFIFWNLLIDKFLIQNLFGFWSFVLRRHLLLLLVTRSICVVVWRQEFFALILVSFSVLLY